MKLRDQLSGAIVDAAVERASQLPPEVVEDLRNRLRSFRVAVTVSHVVVVDVEAENSRAASHIAVDKVRTAQIQVAGVSQEISTLEILTTRARRIA